MGAVLLGLVAIAGPRLLSGSGQPSERGQDRPAPPGTVSTSPTPPALRSASPLRWKVRGDLADDAAFVRAVEKRARRDLPERAKVLVAVTLPEGSRVAVLGTFPSETPDSGFVGATLVAVHVPAGSDVAAGKVTFEGGIGGPDDLGGWAGHGRDGAVYAVVFGRPAPLSGEISAAISYRPDGTASRRWQPLSGRDGTTVVRLHGQVDPMVAARAKDLDGSTSYPLMLMVDGQKLGDRGQQKAVVRVEGLSSRSYRGPVAAEVPDLVATAAAPLLDLATVKARVVWSGALGGGRTAVLVRLRRPDGASFQTLVLDSGAGEAYPVGIRPVQWDHADVLPWLLASGQEGLPLLLLNPSGAGELVVKPVGGAARHVRIGRDGVARLGDDQAVAARRLFGASATVRDHTGRLVVRTTLTDVEADPFLVAS